MASKTEYDQDVSSAESIPLATVVPYSSTFTATAIPTDRFEDDSVADNTTDQEVQGRRREQDGIPTAPFLAADDQSTDKNRSDSERVRVGETAGLASADEEKQDIDRARRKIGATQYYSKEAVRAANENAQRRDREGLKITEDKYSRPGELFVGKSNKDDPDATDYSNKKGGGYEVSEYETTDYSTKKYDTSYEYKSVYD